MNREANILGIALAVTLLLLWHAIQNVMVGGSDQKDEPERTQPVRSINPADWIVSDDYPPAAIRAELQGTTRIEMRFAPDGRIVACSIVQTSGHAMLDRAACDAVRRRGRLPQVARDGAERVVSRRVVWRLPEP